MRREPNPDIPACAAALRRSRPLRAALALALLSLLWGYNWVVMKQVLRDVGPFDFTALRAVLGALTLFAALLLARRPLKPPPLRLTLILGLLQTAAFMGLVQWALVSGGAGKTAVLAYTMPFWLILLSRLLGERVRGGHWLAVALAAGGLVLILEPWHMAGTAASTVVAMLAGLAWAGAAIATKRGRAKTPVDLLSLAAWQMLVGTAALVLVALLVQERPIAATPYFIGALLYNGVLCTGLAWVLWLYILDNLPAAVAGLASLAAPTVGVLAAWIELGERPDRAEFIGMLLIAAALGTLALLAFRARRA